MTDTVATYMHKSHLARQRQEEFAKVVRERAKEEKKSIPVGSPKDLALSLPAAFAGMAGDAFEIADMVGIATPKNPFMSTKDIQDELEVEQSVASVVGELLSPMPGQEVKNALFIGAVGAERLGGVVAKSLEKFKDLKIDTVMDSEGYFKTGWFNWFDNQPRYHLSDADVFVNQDLLWDLAKAKNLKTGETSRLYTTLGELWPHEELFKAYPSLRGASIWIDVRAVNKKGDLVIEYLPRHGTVAEARTNRITGQSRVRIMNLRNPEDLREIVIHEVDHLKNSLEGFNSGTSPKVFQDALDGAKDAMIEKQVLLDIDKGKLTDDLLDESYWEYADELAARFNIPLEEAEKVVQQSLNSTDPDRLGLVTRMEEDHLRTVGTLLEDLGGEGLTREWIEQMPRPAIRRLARSRYLRQDSEVEARLSQYLRDTKPGQVEMSPDLVKKIDDPVNPEQVVTGGVQSDVAESIEDLYIEPSYLLTGSGKQRIEFLRNPTQRELKKYMKTHNPINLRYMYSETEGLLVWDAALALHDDFVKGLKIKNAGINSVRSRGNREKWDIKEWGDIEPADAEMILLGRIGE